MDKNGLIKKAEETLIFLWNDKSATKKQKWKLKQLGVPFDKNLSKAHAFFLIRQKIDGVRLPNDFVQNPEKESK